MESLSKTKVPDDSLINDLWMTSLGLSCVDAADELGLFAALESAAKSSSQLSPELQLEAGALEVLCRVLVSMKLLELAGEQFSLNEVWIGPRLNRHVVS